MISRYRMRTYIQGLIRVQYVNGFYFAAIETENYSAERLRDIIGISAFAARELETVKQQVKEAGYQLEIES